MPCIRFQWNLLVCIRTSEVTLACGPPEAPHVLSGNDTCNPVVAQIWGQLPLQEMTTQHELPHELAAIGAVASIDTVTRLDMEAPQLHRLALARPAGNSLAPERGWICIAWLAQ